MRQPIMVLLAAALALSAGACTVPSALQAKGSGTQTPATAPVASGVVIAGTVMAPAGVIALGGGNVVAIGGGNVVSKGSGSVIAVGGGNLQGDRRVMALEQSPLANAEVFLADAAGNPIPGLDAVKTDAKGQYKFPSVPKGYTFVVAAKVKTKDGKAGTLQTLAKSADLGATADMDAATTMVTAAVVDGQGSSLGNFNPATFKTAAQATAKNLKPEELPDWSDRSAVLARIGELSKTVAELKNSLEQIKSDLKDIKTSLDDLKQQLANRPQPGQPQPGPPMPAQPVQPGQLQPTQPMPPAPMPTGQPGQVPPAQPQPPAGGMPPAFPQGCDPAPYNRLDRNGDGWLDHDEFVAQFANVKLEAGSPTPDEQFRKRDMNGDGRIGPYEWCQAGAPATGTATPPPQTGTQPDPMAGDPNAVSCSAPMQHNFKLTGGYSDAAYPLTLVVQVPNANPPRQWLKGQVEKPGALVSGQLPEGCPHQYLVYGRDGAVLADKTFTVPLGAAADVALPI
jgi:hypothetical protein